MGIKEGKGRLLTKQSTNKREKKDTNVDGKASGKIYG
jgi:hypothetical protein